MRSNPLIRFHPRARRVRRSALPLALALWLGGGAAAATPPQGSAPELDWVVSGTEVFDTTAQLIQVGPPGQPTRPLLVVGGRVRIRNFTILPGASLRVMGPHPFRLSATGDVVLRGPLILSGFDAQSVATLNTGNQPEPGGAGGPGGGDGGASSTETTTSTPAGSAGSGPAGLSGGGGGESARPSGNFGVDGRRPGGGAGGRFARDQGGRNVAGDGYPGAAQSIGVVSGQTPARGGRLNPGPFVDGDDGNDFFGTKAILDPNGLPIALVRGELTRLLAGFGGGGGGDSTTSPVFPPTNWTPASDDKGGAGGGGGGAGVVRALGRIVFGAGGVIRCDGGAGGLGENTLFLDHVGGSGGSGSGGHVILESATQIDLTDGDPAGAGRGLRVRAWGGPEVRGPLTNGNGMPVPQGVSHGGAGGPGVIQLHVPVIGRTIGDDPNDTIVVPSYAVSANNPLAPVVQPPPEVLVPRHGGDGRAGVLASRWLRPDEARALALGVAEALSSGLVLPGSWEVQVVPVDATGRPRADAPLVEWTSDPRVLAVLGEAPVRIRFRLSPHAGS